MHFEGYTQPFCWHHNFQSSDTSSFFASGLQFGHIWTCTGRPSPLRVHVHCPQQQPFILATVFACSWIPLDKQTSALRTSGSHPVGRRSAYSAQHKDGAEVPAPAFRARQPHVHTRSPNTGGNSACRCQAVAAAPSKGHGGQLWLGRDSKWFSLSPAAPASRRAAWLENWAESQELLNYIPDSAINFLYGLGQLVSPASLGFSLDKEGKIVNIMDL